MVWPNPPRPVIRPQTTPRTSGRPRPVRLPSSERRFGKTHADAGADAGRQADGEGFPAVVRGEGGGEERGERRDRAVHQARPAGLNHLKHEKPVAAAASSSFRHAAAICSAA